MPEISFTKEPENLIQHNSLVYIFDKKESGTSPIEPSPKKTGIIGPE
jgi:hypothetical protein